MVHTFNLSVWEVVAGGSVEGHPLLYSELEVSLGYMEPCLGKKF